MVVDLGRVFYAAAQLVYDRTSRQPQKRDLASTGCKQRRAAHWDSIFFTPLYQDPRALASFPSQAVLTTREKGGRDAWVIRGDFTGVSGSGCIFSVK